MTEYLDVDAIQEKYGAFSDTSERAFQVRMLCAEIERLRGEHLDDQSFEELVADASKHFTGPTPAIMITILKRCAEVLEGIDDSRNDNDSECPMCGCWHHAKGCDLVAIRKDLTALLGEGDQ